LSHRALSLISRPVSRVLYGATLAAFAPGVTRDGHSSGTPVARRLKQPTRTAGSGHRSRNRLRDPAPSLFGLAPGGVCRAADVAADAVRSYRTFSPLPRLIRNAPRRFVFCGTVPEIACAIPPDVIRHRTSMEPGLSSPATFRSLPERPSGRLTPSGWGRNRPPSRLHPTIQLIKGYRFAHNASGADLTFATHPAAGLRSECQIQSSTRNLYLLVVL
jgi:hypothetical protein